VAYLPAQAVEDLVAHGPVALGPFWVVEALAIARLSAARRRARGHDSARRNRETVIAETQHAYRRRSVRSYAAGTRRASGCEWFGFNPAGPKASRA
jgi:hypothetical protein